MTWNPLNDYPREMGFPHRRGIVYNRKELITKLNLYNHKTDVFTSLYSFQQLNDKRTRGLYNTAILNKIFLDLDDPQDTETIKSIHNYCLEKDYLHCMIWSGGGFHIYIGSIGNNLEYKKDALINAQIRICNDVDLSIGVGNGFDVDGHIIGNLAQMVRVPCSFNPKRKRYCISIKEEDLTSIEDLKKKSKKNNYRLKIYGNKLLDLTEFDKESDTHKYETIDLGIPMDSIGLEYISVDKFPECIKNLLTERFINHRQRYILILYMRELGIPIEDTISLLQKYLDIKTFVHCVREERQIFWIYNRSNLCFPSCETLRMEGFCTDKDCSGAKLY